MQRIDIGRRVAAFARLLGIFLLGLLVTGVSAQPAGSPPVGPVQDKATPTPAPAIPYVPARPLDTLLAKSTIGEIRLRDAQDYYKWFKPAIAPEVPAERVPEMPTDWVLRLAAQLSLDRAMEKKADAEAAKDAALKLDYEQHFHEYLLNYAIDELKKRLIDQKLVEPTEAELRAYYDQHKAEYHQPFQFSMRHIFMMTYERYEVQKGDSLESIAQKISGNPAAIANIRSDVESRPLRWVPPDMRDKQLFKPLDVGEKLLVPMSPAKAQEVKKKMEEISKKINAKEATFEQMAGQFSESEGDVRGAVIGPLPTGIRPISDQIMEAAKKTPAGGVSDIFQTKHGFNMIQVVEKLEEGTKPFEAVKKGPLQFNAPGITEILKKKQSEKLEVNLSNELFTLPEFKMDWETLAKAPKLPDDAVIFRAGDIPMPWSKLKSSFERNWGETQPTHDQFINFLKHFPPAQFALTLLWCETHKIWQEPALNRAYAAVRTGSYAKSYLERELAKVEAAATTPELVKAFFDKNLKTRFTIPERLSFQVVELRPGPQFATASEKEKKEMLDNLEADLKKKLPSLETIDQFISFADLTNQASGASKQQNPNHPLEMKDASMMMIPGETAAKVKDLAEGKYSEPYREDNAIRSVAVTRRIPAEQRGFEESRAEIAAGLKQEARNNGVAPITRKILEEFKIELVLKDKP